MSPPRHSLPRLAATPTDAARDDVAHAAFIVPERFGSVEFGALFARPAPLDVRDARPAPERVLATVLAAEVAEAERGAALLGWVLRAGLHAGEVSVPPGDAGAGPRGGLALHLALRVAALARP